MTSKKKDPMLVGYQYAYDKTKNPYDFITDPETGLRPGQNHQPMSWLLTNLKDGISNVTIPPLSVWKEGQWLVSIDETEIVSSTGTIPDGKDAFDTWVTSGEGTPGNLLWRLFLLPDDASRTGLNDDMSPKHPVMWPKKLKDPSPVKYQTSGSGWQTGWSSSSTKVDTSPRLPLGTRIRCTKCGHWFRVDDLAGHVECCPQVNQFSDWAIGCECCTSMDDTVKVKDGFPREMYGAADPEPAQDPLPEPEEVAADGVGAASA